MTKQVQEAYIVAATRTPVGKAPRGMMRNVRPDDMLAHVIRSAMAQVPELDPALVADVVTGCAFPEAEQGLNMARIGALLAGLPDTVGGITINRYCSSGINAVQMAADRIRLGEADVVIATGSESMSMVPMMGNKVSLNPEIFARDENLAIAYGMGLTAEKVAQQPAEGRSVGDHPRHRRHRVRRVQGRDQPADRDLPHPEPRDRRSHRQDPRARHRRRPARGHLDRGPG